MADIDTLVSDIYSYVAGKGNFPDPTPEDFERLAEITSKMMVARFTERKASQAEDTAKFTLRMSNYGLPLRKLWFENKYPTKFKYQPEDLLKFLIGDTCESMLLFVAEKTGHTITHFQKEVMVDGLVGHIDAVIDGWLIDIKSASKFSFDKKFVKVGLLTGADDFAYIPQIKAYQEAFKDDPSIKGVGFLAQNKETGELCLLKLPSSVRYDVSSKIEDTRSAIAAPTPPKEKCYPEEVEDSGNRTIARNCTYCRFKKECWKDDNFGYGLRAFKYSNGIKYYSHIEKLPRVEEIDLDERS